MFRLKYQVRFSNKGLVRSIVIIGVILYLFSMVVFPFYKGDWNYVQAVWNNWQGLNVGVLALISSVIALRISLINENKQRSRNFTAVRAFLPSALDELSNYLKSYSEYLDDTWHLTESGTITRTKPELPSGYKNVFQECIKHAEPDVGDYLAKILANLQVVDARMRDFNPSHVRNAVKLEIIDMLVRIGEIYALVDSLFEFARGEKDFEKKYLTKMDFQKAYNLLNINTDHISVSVNGSLDAATKRFIKAKHS